MFDVKNGIMRLITDIVLHEEVRINSRICISVSVDVKIKVIINRP